MPFCGKGICSATISTTVGIAEFFRHRFARFGHDREIDDAFLQCHHALDGAADHAQIDIFERIDADFLQAHFQRELRGGSGDMSAADLAAQVFRFLDARLGHQIIGQHIDVAGNGDDVAAGEPRAC